MDNPFSSENQTKYTYAYKGQLLSLPQIPKNTGVNLSVLKARVRRLGWSIEDAVEKPVTGFSSVKTPRKFNFEGRSMTLTEIAAFTGVERSLLDNRLQRGYSIERAVTQPKGNHKGRPKRAQTR